MSRSLQRPNPGFVLLVSTVSAFCTAFAGYSVNVALPLIGAEFHLGGVHLNWVVTAFVLTSAALVMPLGRVGDLWGRQKVFVAGSVAYVVLSAASALAPDANWLIVARALGGVGAAMAFGTVTAVLVAAFPPEQRGRVLGINISMVYFGLSAGPVLGGLVTEAWGWRSLFWLHAALAAVVVVFLFFGRLGNDKEDHPGRFDFVGTVFYAVGLTLLLLGLSDPVHLSGILALAGGAAVLGIFWWIETRAANPILPVKLMTQNRGFAFSNLAAVFSYAATFAVAFFLSLYLEVVRGLSPAQAGLFLIAQPLVQALFSPLMGRLSDRIPPRTLASVGMGLNAVGLIALAWLGAQTPLWLVLAALTVIGLGFAFFSSPNTNAIMGSVEKKHLGLASATLATMRVVGQMLSMGLALVLMSLWLGAAPVAAARGQFLAAQSWGFAISALLCALGIGASVARGKQPAA